MQPSLSSATPKNLRALYSWEYKSILANGGSLRYPKNLRASYSANNARPRLRRIVLASCTARR